MQPAVPRPRLGLRENLGQFSLLVVFGITKALTNYLAGRLAARHGLWPEPFYLWVVHVVLGLGLSALAVRETRHHVAQEAQALPGGAANGNLPPPSQGEIFKRMSLTDRNLSSVSKAGLVNNLNEGMAQIFTGALSDRVGRKPLIVWGMWAPLTID